MQHSQIFVNLAVKDLKRTDDFHTLLGYSFNPQFTRPRRPWRGTIAHDRRAAAAPGCLNR
jgi:hypothetical protein